MDATHAFQIAHEAETFDPPFVDTTDRSATFAEALASYGRAQALVDRTDPTDIAFEVRVAARHELLIDLFRTPAPDLAALAHKLALFAADDRHELTSAAEITKVLEEDAKRLATSPPATFTDQRHHDAFRDRRTFWLSDETAGTYERQRECDAILRHERATSPAAIALKLRAALYTNTGEDWLEKAACGELVADFDEKLDMDDYVNQLLWGAITDLEAIQPQRAWPTAIARKGEPTPVRRASETFELASRDQELLDNAKSGDLDWFSEDRRTANYRSYVAAQHAILNHRPLNAEDALLSAATISDMLDDLENLLDADEMPSEIDRARDLRVFTALRVGTAALVAYLGDTVIVTSPEKVEAALSSVEWATKRFRRAVEVAA